MAAPQVTPINEQWHAWGFLVWDPSDGIVTRDTITIASGAGIVTAGTVMGQISVGAGAAAALGTNTGNGTFGAITVGSPAIAGVYQVTFEAATDFTVEDPNGHEVGHGVTGTAFSAGGLGFTITAGGTAFAPGDSFNLTVAAGSGKWVPYDPTGADGREVAGAILGSGYKDATSADKPAGALVRGPARVNSGELVWGVNVTTGAQKTAALASLKALGIQAT
ncbi:MAG TPA: head decoration protein [Caulobacteraceae bacterium]|nr:head decoration protein [Caulobacteraceae bacterium]